MCSRFSWHLRCFVHETFHLNPHSKVLTEGPTENETFGRPRHPETFTLKPHSKD